MNTLGEMADWAANNPGLASLAFVALMVVFALGVTWWVLKGERIDDTDSAGA